MQCIIYTYSLQVYVQVYVHELSELCIHVVETKNMICSSTITKYKIFYEGIKEENEMKMDSVIHNYVCTYSNETMLSTQVPFID